LEEKAIMNIHVADVECVNFDDAEHFPAYTPVRYVERTYLANMYGRLFIGRTGDFSRVVGEPVMGWFAPVPDDCDLDDFEF
jgi:hypothetical protein